MEAHTWTLLAVDCDGGSQLMTSEESGQPIVSIRMIIIVAAHTLWPILLSKSWTIRNPLLIGGCGPTTPSVQKIPNLSGSTWSANPSGFALASVELSISIFHGSLITTGSRSHGSVERIELITSFTASIVVPMTPTDEA